MKKIFLAVCFFSCLSSFSQTEETVGTQFYKRLFEYDFVERKPIFPFTADSLRNFYLSHFTGFDSLITKCIERGDTAKYIRVHFEFVLDEISAVLKPIFFWPSCWLYFYPWLKSFCFYSIYGPHFFC